MLTPEYLKDVPENIIKLYQELEEFIVADFARRIAKAGSVTDTAKWQLERARELGISLELIRKKLKEILDLSDDEVDDVFEESANTSINNDDNFYEEAGKKPISLEDLKSLKEYIELAKKQTKGEFYNITQSLGFAEIVNGRVVYKPIAKYYQDALDFAQLQISSGVIDYNTAIRNAIMKLCDSGIRYVDYYSGWSNRIDVATRRAVLTGVNQMANKLTEMYADEMGCDFVETTAHSGARPSHSTWQGKVFCRSGTSKEYPDFVTSTGYGTGPGLGGWNCRHSFHPFFPGISTPAYTKENLKNIDPPPFEYKGKTYTYYEATQKQRQIERNIRKTKLELVGYKEAGLKDDFTAASIKLNRQKEAYKEFSNAANIRLKNNRTQLYKYDKSVSQKAVWSNKKVEKEANKLYNLGNTKDNVSAYLRDKPIRDKILSGQMNLNIETGKQGKHIKGHNNYIEGRSYLTISLEDAQKLLVKHAGTGILLRDKNGNWKNQEVVFTDKDIGINVSMIDGSELLTKNFTIHYSKKGTHIVPR